MATAARSQPQGLARIDYSNPNTKGLGIAIGFFGNNLVDAVTGIPIKRVGNYNTTVINPVPTPYGLGISEPRVSNDSVYVELPFKGNVSFVRLATFVVNTSVTVGNVLLNGDTNGNRFRSGNTSSQLYYRNNAGEKVVGAYISWADTTVEFSGLTDGVHTVAFMAAEGQPLKLYLDGQLVAQSGIVNSLYCTQTIAPFAFEDPSLYSSGAGVSLFKAIFTGFYDEAQVASLTRNPWQLFEASSRSQFLVSTAANVTPPVVDLSTKLGISGSVQSAYSSTPKITQVTIGATSSQNLAPDTLAASTNLTGTVANVQDSPSSPDANWLTVTSATSASNTAARLTFPTPSVQLQTGAGLQTFNVWWRKNNTAGTNAVTATVSLYENGVLKGSASAVQTVTSTTGSLFSFTWDASLLTDKTGAGVEIYIAQTAGASTQSSKARYLEIGAVQWVAASKVPDVTVSTNGIVNLAADGSSQSNYSLTPIVGLNLTAVSVSQASTSSTGAVSVAKNLTSATSAQLATSSTGAIAQANNLVPVGSSQGNSASTGAVSVTVIINLSADGSSQLNISGNNVVFDSGFGGQSGVEITQSAPAAVSLAVDGSSQASTSSTGAVTLAVALTGATSVQNASSGTGTLTASQNLVVASSTQSGSSATGTITRTVGLTGAGSSQGNTSSTGSLNAASPLTGTNSSQSNNASTGNVSQVQSLVGTNVGQSNTSSTGSVSAVQNLAAANASQGNASSNGSLSATITLTAASSAQSNASGTGVVTKVVSLSVTSSGQANAASTDSVSQVQNLATAGSSQDNFCSAPSLTGAATLNALNASQGNTSSTATITQVRTLAVAGSSQASGSSAGSVAVTRDLVGTNSSASNAAGTGSITVVHVLVSASSVEASVSSTGSVGQVQQLVIAPSSQANAASVGSVASNAVMVNLTGAGSSASNNSGIVAIAVAHNLQTAGSTGQPTSGGVAITSMQLLGVSSAVQSNTSSTGLIAKLVSLIAAASTQSNSTLSGVIAQIANLVASSTLQGNTSTGGKITSVQWLMADGAAQANVPSVGQIIIGALIVLGDVLVSVDFEPYIVTSESQVYLVSVIDNPYSVTVKELIDAN